MKLYITETSPFARMVRVMIIEKELQARVDVIVTKTRIANNPYYAINPSGRVPYLVRDDGAVFVHLHPMGTISVAAQRMLSRGRGDAHGMSMGGDAGIGDTLHFPYAFPARGNYTVWVQVKRHGRVLTGAFTVAVATDAGR